MKLCQTERPSVLFFRWFALLRWLCWCSGHWAGVEVEMLSLQCKSSKSIRITYGFGSIGSPVILRGRLGRHTQTCVKAKLALWFLQYPMPSKCLLFCKLLNPCVRSYGGPTVHDSSEASKLRRQVPCRRWLALSLCLWSRPEAFQMLHAADLVLLNIVLVWNLQKQKVKWYCKRKPLLRWG